MTLSEQIERIIPVLQDSAVMVDEKLAMYHEGLTPYSEVAKAIIYHDAIIENIPTECL